MGKDITGYEVTRRGEVFSVDHNWRGYGKRRLKESMNSYGYPSVRITVDGVRRRYCVHILVAERFLGEKPTPQHEVCHIDGDKKNNQASNLRWGTQKDNARDRDIHGKTSRGESHSQAIKRGIKKSVNQYWKHARKAEGR
jgi:hypothetical protein